MDDNKFDSALRSKLHDYEGPGFDPASLASLHHQMASEVTTPWYTLRSTELLTGSGLLVATLLIIGFQWYSAQKNSALLQSRLSELQAQIKNNEINSQGTNQNSQPLILRDTVIVTQNEAFSHTSYTLLLEKVATLETMLEQFRAEMRISNERAIHRTPERADDLTSTAFEAASASQTLRVIPREVTVASERASADAMSLTTPTSVQKLSGKTILDIQRHYHQGIGIRVGPVAALSRGSYTIGDGRYDFGVGILGDFILSPSFSVETGVVHTLRHYHIPGADIGEATNLPGTDPDLGDVRSADIDSWIFEVPIQLKYRFPLSMKASWTAGIGYSQLFYTKQILEYDYLFDNNQAASLNTSYKESGVKTYPGTLSLSVGFTNELKHNQFLETSIFYQHGLGNSGVEQTRPLFVGIRGAYWFSVR